MPIPWCMRFGAPALLGCCLVSFSAAAATYEGKVLSGFEFYPVRQPLKKEDLAKILGLSVGEPLTPRKLQDALQRLYTTGEYRDISVDASVVDNRVTLRFQTTPSLFVGDVTVDGAKEPPNEGQLESATKLQLGTEYTEDRLAEAVDNLRDSLKRNGFYAPVISKDVVPDPATQQVNFHFTIDTGKRARFDGVLVTGNPGRSNSSIIHSTGWKVLGLRWHNVTETRLQSGLESVRKYYQSHDHLLARVRLLKLDYHPETNRVTPNLEIDAGPRVQVVTEGEKVSKGKLRQLLPIYEERSVDKDLLVEGSRNLLEYFRSQGYFDATVDFHVDSKPDGSRVIAYSIDKNERHTFVALSIHGNNYFDVPALRERMYLRPASFPRYRRGRYSREYLDKDLDAIRDLYRANGFRRVEVVSREEHDYHGKTSQIAISIQINEGPQSFVSSLALEGVTPADRDYLRSILHSTEGQLFSDLNIANDRDAILGYFYNDGYPDATLDYESTPASGPDHINVKFVVKRGERQLVRDVLIGGLEHTRPALAARSISVKSGQALSQSSITDSQRRLYDLGIFAKVQTALQNPDGTEPAKNVLYKVEEASPYSVNVGFGAEIARIGTVSATDLSSPAGTTGFSPRVSLGISRLNLLGLGHTVSLQTQVSTLEQRALFSYLVPQFVGTRNFSLQFTGLFDDSRDVRTFSSRRLEGSVQVGEKVSKSLTLQYRLTYRKVNILGTPLVNPELIPLLSQPVRVGLVSTTIIQDRRDNLTDPHSGIYNTLDIGLATNLLGSETRFWRMLYRNATYHRITKDLVFARYTSVADIHRYSGALDIPLAERFFGGGSSTHRGFPDNQAGPRDLVTGFPLGGDALFFNTMELRFPLIGDDLGAVLFHDMGNVYRKFSDISLRFRQRDLQDFNYAVQSAGLGIRYRTPVGPIRLDLALSPNPPRFNGFRGTTAELQFGCKNPITGQPVPCQTVRQRINIFQFHFSLGQAF